MFGQPLCQQKEDNKVMNKYLDKAGLQDFATKLTEKYKTLFSSPLTASTVAGMTDHTKVYVYTGSETGYTSGHWYFWNGSAWADGGVYNAQAINTDTTLSISGAAADAKVAGDEITGLNRDLIRAKSEIESGMFNSTSANGWWLVSNGVFQNSVTTVLGTKKFSVKPGDIIYAKVSGEKYYLFWESDGTFISGTRKDYGYITAPSNAAICAIDYLTAQGNSIVVRISNETYDSLAETENRVAILDGDKISALSTNWYWYVADGGIGAVSSLVGTEKFIVNGGDTVEATNITGEKYYLFWESDGTYISGQRVDSGAKSIPSNAYYCALDYLVSTGVEKAEFEVLKAQPQENEGNVTCVRNGNDIQIKTSLLNTTKYIGVNASLNGSYNGGFNLSKYVIADSKPSISAIITGTDFKWAGDDICPINCNSSYMGGNHGKEPVFKIELSSHGKTTDDIGSVWTSANGYDYVIYKIDDSSHISIMGDYVGGYEKIVTTTPTAPLTHKSGATHTGDIAFASVTSQQLRPITNRKSVIVRNDSLEELSANGYITGRYIEIVESYNIISLYALAAYLKSNVGTCTNESYYSNSISGDALVQNVYRFSEGGGESICVNVTPLDIMYMLFIGGTQCSTIGDDFYVPYTLYDSITTQDSNTVRLDSSKWRDANFPPYKYYQMDSSGNGFAVGYCIDTPQGLPSNRKDFCSDEAGFYYGSSHKMYPKFYQKSSHPDVYGKSFCFYAFRAPFIKTSNMIYLWYETADATYMELETFASWAGVVDFPKHALGKEITVLKKTDSVNIPDDIINTGSMLITTSGAGSITLKFA